MRYTLWRPLTPCLVLNTSTLPNTRTAGGEQPNNRATERQHRARAAFAYHAHTTATEQPSNRATKRQHPLHTTPTPHHTTARDRGRTFSLFDGSCFSFLAPPALLALAAPGRLLPASATAFRFRPADAVSVSAAGGVRARPALKKTTTTDSKKSPWLIHLKFLA